MTGAQMQLGVESPPESLPERLVSTGDVAEVCRLAGLEEQPGGRIWADSRVRIGAAVAEVSGVLLHVRICTAAKERVGTLQRDVDAGLLWLLVRAVQGAGQ